MLVMDRHQVRSHLPGSIFVQRRPKKGEGEKCSPPLIASPTLPVLRSCSFLSIERISFLVLVYVFFVLRVVVQNLFDDRSNRTHTSLQKTAGLRYTKKKKSTHLKLRLQTKLCDSGVSPLEKKSDFWVAYTWSRQC